MDAGSARNLPFQHFFSTETKCQKIMEALNNGQFQYFCREKQKKELQKLIINGAIGKLRHLCLNGHANLASIILDTQTT